MLYPKRIAGGTVGCQGARVERRERGMALVVVLGILLIITVLVVALILLASNERRLSSLALASAQARVFADSAANIAVARISEAISRGKLAGHSWASEPGRITIFSIEDPSGSITRESFDLFSAMAAEGNSVDLNAPSLSGGFPIAPPREGSTLATMKVGWQSLLRDPSQPASSENPIVGRIAWWVDDESCKVNINTADGSRKGNDGHYGGSPTANPSDGYSFGFGTPSEISLAALSSVSQDAARAIADRAWEEEYHSAEEIVRATGADGQPVVSRTDFEALRFDITHYNSSPELNFLGEPRIALGNGRLEAGNSPRQNTMLGRLELPAAMDGPGGLPQALTMENELLPMDFQYPQPSQLPRPPYLPEGGFSFSPSASTFAMNSLPTDASAYQVGTIIANWLNGVNLRGESFTWPRFAGADAGGFAGKYTPQQLDAITLQILDISSKAVLVDNQSGFSAPTILPEGWLSGEPVLGVGRSAFLTEVLLTVINSIGDPHGYGLRIGNSDYAYPSARFSFVVEYYHPARFAGMPASRPYTLQEHQWGGYGHARTGANFYDRPIMDSDDNYRVVGPNALGDYWGGNTLRALDQNGETAGIDFSGQSSLWDDIDQASAEAYHPYCMRFDANGEPTGIYSGAVYAAPHTNPRITGVLSINTPFNITRERSPGTYSSAMNVNSTIAHPMRPGTTELRLEGGLQIWHRNSSGSSGYRMPILAPFLSTIPELTGMDLTDSAVVGDLLAHVIPLELTIPVPGQRRILARVADPMINQFPADWETIVQPADNEITLLWQTNSTRSYRRGGENAYDPFFDELPPVVGGNQPRRPEDFDGDNPGFRPSGGGDPLSLWMPRQDPRIPKQARLPSVGALFALRTGLFPDPGVASLPVMQQRGVPFRGLNMSPSEQSSQRSEGGGSYPDWAMLDLFYVPFLPQRPYGSGTGLKPESSVQQTQPFRRLTDGGATIGKMNINNPPVPYPFGEDPTINEQPPRRSALEAVFYRLRPSNSYAADGSPIYSEIDELGARNIVEGIAEFQRVNGPFLMAGEIANVPEVAEYLYTFSAQTSGPNRSASISRNDVVRDVVGAITTRSNTYSIWVVAQTITKAPGNTNYGEYEPGDVVTSEVRRRYLVERFIETGADGLPGDTSPTNPNPSPNTFSVTHPEGDPISTTSPVYHPSLDYPLPYQWRTLAVENIR